MARFRLFSSLCLCLAALSACAVGYPPPEDSGLVALRPYPTSADVCQVIGESDATAEDLDHTQLLIGCPTGETGAIADRVDDGAVLLREEGEWTLLNVPKRKRSTGSLLELLGAPQCFVVCASYTR